MWRKLDPRTVHPTSQNFSISVFVHIPRTTLPEFRITSFISSWLANLSISDGICTNRNLRTCDPAVTQACRLSKAVLCFEVREFRDGSREESKGEEGWRNLLQVQNVSICKCSINSYATGKNTYHMQYIFIVSAQTHQPKLNEKHKSIFSPSWFHLILTPCACGNYRAPLRSSSQRVGMTNSIAQLQKGSLSIIIMVHSRHLCAHTHWKVAVLGHYNFLVKNKNVMAITALRHYGTWTT